MKVVRAKYAGACYGVQRALDLAQETAVSCSNAATFGPLIHNPLVVAELQSAGIGVVNSIDEARAARCSVLVIRSHGVVPQVKEEILAAGMELVDATCPHVERAQKAAAKLACEGRHVVIVGEKGHPEVEGLTAYALREGVPVTVVGGVQDLPNSIEGPVGVVVQTTQKKAVLEEVSAALKSMCEDVKVCNTVCFATQQRQDAAADMAKQVDAIVVIGGRNSSNTTRLAEICKALCSHTYHVESPVELDPSWFDGCTSVGVTAGASTPESHILKTISYIEAL